MKADDTKDPSQNQEEQENTGTDAQKITRRHLEDEDDIITDEDIRNIKIGPIRQEPIATGAELSEIIKEREEMDDIKDSNSEEDSSEDKKDGESPAKPVTPWDTIGG